jgi:hypothetical protein
MGRKKLALMGGLGYGNWIVFQTLWELLFDGDFYRGWKSEIGSFLSSMIHAGLYG